jgi:hypothetical protein
MKLLKDWNNNKFLKQDPLQLRRGFFHLKIFWKISGIYFKIIKHEKESKINRKRLGSFG